MLSLFYENILFFFDFIYFEIVKFGFEKSDTFPLKTNTDV